MAIGCEIVYTYPSSYILIKMIWFDVKIEGVNKYLLLKKLNFIYSPHPQYDPKYESTKIENY